MSNFKTVLYEILSNSTIYGLCNLIASRNVYSRALWILFIILSFVLCLKFTYDTILNYLRYDTITKISQVYENPSQFPTLTFCSSTPLEKSLEKSITNCYFGFDTGCLKQPYSYFEIFNNTIFKSCFRFNSGRNNSGEPTQILNSIVGGRDDSFFISTTFKARHFLWIHNYSKTPKLASYLDGDVNKIVIGPGFYTVIEIEKTVVSRQPKPYSNCYKNVSDFEKNKTLIEYFSRIGAPYNQADCQNLCFDLDYLENKPCDCNSTLGNVWLDCYYGYEKKNEDECTYKYRHEFSKKKILTKCIDYCPEECDYTFYSTSINADNDPERKTKLRIYYKSLRYTVISEEPKFQIFDLVSNVGGIFGLFVGIGFVTFFEVFHIVLEVFLAIFTNEANRINNVLFARTDLKK